MSFNSKYTGAQVEELLGKIPTANDVWHTGNFNPANYLSLEGGKLKKSVQTVLTLDAQAMGNQNYLGFVNGQTDLGNIGFSNIDIPVFRNSSNVNYKLWHEGNDGSDSGLDADLLDGKHLSDILNSNVTSATKLQTARTIWGKSFDGTEDVSGDIYTQSHSLLGTYGGAFLYAGIRDGEALSIEPLDSNGTWLNSGITLLKNSNVGSGTTSPLYKLHVDGTMYGDLKMKTPRTIWGKSFDGTGNIGGDILLQMGASSYNVGPKAYFDIAGRGKVGSIQGLYTGVDWNASSNYAKGALVFQTYNSDTINDAMFINYLGDVGIGTTNPTTKLDVYGSIHAADDIQLDNGSRILIKDGDNIYRNVLTFNNQKLLLIGDNTTPGYTTVIDGESIHLRASNYAYGIYVNYYGHVGIANTSPKYNLDVTGSIHSSGSITQDSDINLKDKIKDVLLSINEIAEAPLFEFTYKSDKDKRIHVGTSAQYWVEKNNWFCEKQDNGYYDMEIQNLALASAISIAKEFKKYKEETESTISSMKKEIEKLKQIVLNMNK